MVHFESVTLNGQKQHNAYIADDENKTNGHAANRELDRLLRDRREELSEALRSFSANVPGGDWVVQSTTNVKTVTVEDLLARIDAEAPKAESFELWVSDDLTLKGSPVAHDIAMSVIVDRLAALGWISDEVTPGDGGRTYKYRREA